MQSKRFKKLGVAFIVVIFFSWLVYFVVDAGQSSRQASVDESTFTGKEGQAALELREKPDGESNPKELLQGSQGPVGESRLQGYGELDAGAIVAEPKTPGMDEKIIKNAELELSIKKGDFDESYGRIVSIARSAGGFVSQSKSRATGESIASGDVTIRVPVEQFEDVITGLRRIGEVRSINISSEDVSEEYVDLRSRLKNWQAQEIALLDLMKSAKSVADSIAIQNNLSQVQMEIERITGRLNFLENRVSYATVRLYIAEPQAGSWQDKLGFSVALENAAKASASILTMLIILTGYLFPLLILSGIGYVVYRGISSRTMTHSSQ